MSVKWDRAKDPDERLDYDLDWLDQAQPALDEGDTIASSEWLEPMPGNLVKESSGVRVGDTRTFIWLTGGTAGADYDLTNRIHTAAGRIMDQTCRLKMKNR